MCGPTTTNSGIAPLRSATAQVPQHVVCNKFALKKFNYRRLAMWNKIIDRLPEEDVEVLCLWSWGGKQNTGSGMRVCYLIDGEWIGSADFAGEVTHWMELPAPPTAESVEDANLQTNNKQSAQFCACGAVADINLCTKCLSEAIVSAAQNCAHL